MHTPHKAKEWLNKAFLLQMQSQNEIKVKVGIRHLTNSCNKMPCVLNKLRHSTYPRTPSGNLIMPMYRHYQLSLSNLCYFSSTPKQRGCSKIVLLQPLCYLVIVRQ